VLGAYLGCAPAAVRLGIGRNGKPTIEGGSAGLDFNLAHSHGFVACVVGRDCQIGIDVEDATQPVRALELARRFFAPSEVADLARLEPEQVAPRFFRYWTLKEACTKARGGTLIDSLDQLCFGFGPDGTPRLTADSDPRWQFAQFHLADRYLSAVALRSEKPFSARRVVVRRCIPLSDAVRPPLARSGSRLELALPHLS
jgi:4'-phosphopantetheinyl transferase